MLNQGNQRGTIVFSKYMRGHYKRVRTGPFSKSETVAFGKNGGKIMSGKISIQEKEEHYKPRIACPGRQTHALPILSIQASDGNTFVQKS